jgi:uncharacterized protein
MNLYIKTDFTKGRGVYSGSKILKGQTIEVCHLLIFSYQDINSCLEAYVYHYDAKRVALALGLGSLYNHSDDPNARYFFDKKEKLLFIEALDDIVKDQEITIDYGYSKEEREKFKII